MNLLVKHIVNHTYRPLVKRYLAKTRMYHYNGLHLEIPPAVFHPGFFFSTRLLLNYISRQPLQDKRLLELGCGSGLIAMQAARKGARVTASDINPVAIEYLHKNCLANGISLTAIETDMFEQLPAGEFDIIAINPPYYKKDPDTIAGHAWYCGKRGEYFKKLFEGLPACIHAETEVLMILFDGCDMEMIAAYAAVNHFLLQPVYSKKNILEENTIYRIEKIEN